MILKKKKIPLYFGPNIFSWPLETVDTFEKHLITTKKFKKNNNNYDYIMGAMNLVPVGVNYEIRP